MPKKKLIRRFEPRFGVSQVMVEAEAKAVGREVENYMRLSLNDVRKMLEERKAAWTTSDANLRSIIERLPEQERLVLQGLLFRDVYHLFELYLAHMRHYPQQETRTNPAAVKDAQPTPFSEWLFA